MAIGRSLELLILGLLLLFATSVNASMVAWMTEVGTHLVFQDPLSGSLFHSSCNGTSELALSFENSVELVTEIEPKRQTSLAGVGWYDGNMTWACVFYQDRMDHLVYSRYDCNETRGGVEPDSFVNLSGILPDNVKAHPETDIVAVLLGADPGIRVYFHDLEMRIHQLRYQDSTGWQHDGPLAGAPSSDLALGAAAAGTGEITVISLQDEHTLAVNSIRTASFGHQDLGDNSPPWKTGKAQLALLVDSDGVRSIFYIGTDNLLHQATSQPSDPASWAIQGSHPGDFWPPAHPSNRELTIASRRGTSSFRLYYHTPDGILNELSFESSTWAASTPVPGYDLTLPSAAPREDPHNEDNAPRPSHVSDKTSKLNLAQQVAVGLGSALLGLVLIFAFTLICYKKRLNECQNQDISREYRRRHGLDIPHSPLNPRFSHVRPYTQFGNLNWETEQIPVEDRVVRPRRACSC